LLRLAGSNQSGVVVFKTRGGGDGLVLGLDDKDQKPYIRCGGSCKLFN
jgi:hypothetical protein